MEYVKLGNSDLNVSRICLGCMGFGEAAAGQHRWTLDEESSNEIIKAALENGINFFDTANGYSAGTSEEYLGRALQKNTQRKRSSLPLRSTLIPADCPERQFTERLTARSGVWEQITWNPSL